MLISKFTHLRCATGVKLFQNFGQLCVLAAIKVQLSQLGHGLEPKTIILCIPQSILFEFIKRILRIYNSKESFCHINKNNNHSSSRPFGCIKMSFNTVTYNIDNPSLIYYFPSKDNWIKIAYLCDWRCKLWLKDVYSSGFLLK